MDKLVVGEVVVVPFPFSDLITFKKRPALVLATVEFNNLILCQITSKSYSSKSAIKLTSDDFQTGSLPLISYARPDKLFTIESSIIIKSVGQLSLQKTNQVLKATRELFPDIQ